MKIKRVILSLILALAVLTCGFVFTACDGGGSEPEKVAIKYYLRADGPPLTLRINKNSEIRFATVPYREHCTFEGFYDAPDDGQQVVDKYGMSQEVASDDMTLWAYWSMADCVIKLDTAEGAFEGEISSTIGLKYDSEITNLPVPVLEGYGFLGWYNGDNAVSDEYGNVLSTKRKLNEQSYLFNDATDDEAVILVAKFALKTYAVRFDFNDNVTETVTLDIEHGKTIPEESIPEVAPIEGKDFIGWSVESYRYTAFEGAVEQNLTLYAIWKSYKIFKFYEDVNDTEPALEQKVLEGEEYSIYTPEKEGRSFLGWHTSKALNDFSPTTIVTYNTGNTQYYARWQLTPYTATFHTACGTLSGSAVADITFNMETAPINLPTTTLENYEFLGWYDNEELSGTAIIQIPTGTIGNKTFYAKWKGEDKTVNLNAGDGYLSQSNRTIKIEYGKEYILPLPVHDGYVFMGYYTAEEGGEKVTDDKGNGLSAWLETEEVTLYAVYERKVLVTVKLNIPNAGKLEVKEYYFKDEQITFSPTLNEGYSFIGWYEKGYDDNSEPLCSTLEYSFVLGAYDLELNLVYKANEYTVTFDAGDGYCEEESQIMTYGEEFTLPVPTLDGYVFVGWMFGDEMVCDKDGVGLGTWSIAEDKTLSAEFYEDDGNSIFVYSVDTLLAIKNNPTAKHVLIRDIDMDGVEWIPFNFSGTIIGNGHKISNLTIQSSSGALGMFLTLSGTIQDLTFRDLSVTSTSYDSVMVGGICATLSGTINKVKLYGDVKGDYCRIGGFAGKVAGGTINDCDNYSTVSSSTYETAVSAGGFTGWFESGTITQCENFGDVTIKNHAGGIIGWSQCENMSYLTNHGKIVATNECAGGIVGLMEKGWSYNLIVDFKNDGNVEAVKFVGGGFGKLVDSFNNNQDNNNSYTVKISKITNEGSISGEDYVGGAIGYLYGSVNGRYSSNNPTLIFTITDLVNTGDISGKTYVGGLLGYAYADNSGSQISNSSSSADITADAIVGGLAGKLENVRMVSCQNTDSTIVATGYHTSGTSYYAYVGGYAGIAYYIDDCHNAVDVTYNNIGVFVGGLAGELQNSNIKNSSNSGNITALKSSYVGGLVGNLTCAWGYEVMNLTNSGNVNGKNYTGGIFGQLINSFNSGQDNSNVYTVKISKITNSGKIIGDERTGGAIGNLYGNCNGRYSSNNPTVMFNCTEFNNTGDVSGTIYVGGLIGYAYSDNTSSQLAQSKSSADIVAQAYVGAVAGRLENVRLISCSNENSTLSATLHYQDGTTFYAFVGGYVGRGYYFEDCHNEMDVIYNGIGAYVGGISGHTNYTVINCSNTATVSAPSSKVVGGIVGSLVANWGYESTQNTNSGNVTGKTSVGGIFGEIWNEFNTNQDNSSVHTMTISKMTNSGNIVGLNLVGGLYGNVYCNITGRYSSNNPSACIVGSEWTNGGAISASGEGVENETVYVGAFAGKIVTDNGNSALTIYSSTGSVNGKVSDDTNLIGAVSNFKINNI